MWAAQGASRTISDRGTYHSLSSAPRRPIRGSGGILVRVRPCRLRGDPLPGHPATRYPATHGPKPRPRPSNSSLPHESETSIGPSCRTRIVSRQVWPGCNFAVSHATVRAARIPSAALSSGRAGGCNPRPRLARRLARACWRGCAGVEQGGPRLTTKVLQPGVVRHARTSCGGGERSCAVSRSCVVRVRAACRACGVSCSCAAP